MTPTAAGPGTDAGFLQLRSFVLAQRRTGGENLLLQDVELDLPAGRFYLLVGKSGGGKSSLLRLLAGLVELREVPPRTAGGLSLLGEPLVGPYPQTLRGRVVTILQDEGLLDELSPRQNVELALRAAGRSQKLAPALLAKVGLDPAPDRVAQLSGGMRKRLAMARALATEPEVLLCDEPTAGLDPEAARQIAGLLHETHQMGRTVLVITHEPEIFAGFSDATLVLDRGARSLRLLGSHETASLPRDGSGDSDEDQGVVLPGLRRYLLAAAAAGETLMHSILRLPPVELPLVVRSVFRCIVQPALFVAAAGAVIGGLTTFFALRNNPLQGAVEGVLTGSGKVLTAVLVPLLSGFFFTARMAAGSAARLGTMKRTQQVAALNTMGIRPADYLLTPLVWGMTLGLPIVTAIGCVAAAFASLIAAQLVVGVTAPSWAAHYFLTVDAADVRGVAFKAALSGYLVAVATYHLATGPKHSGHDVGESVNASIVLGMALVLAVHAGVTFLQYA